jgi:hypothetical protein
MTTVNLGPEFNTNPGAPESLVARTLLELDRQVPDDYIQFMTEANGGEGFINGHYLILWPLEELAASNRTFEDIIDVKEVMWFGSNGGGEAFGFDWLEKGAVVECPMIGMERRYLLPCATTFSKFLQNPTGFKHDA